MMKFSLYRRTLVICVTLWLGGAGALAGTGQVLRLEELDDDGKTTPLGDKPLAIVDINSEIKVQLDPTVLTAKVTRLLGDGAALDELIGRAVVLAEVSRQGLELIEPLTRALERFGQSEKTPNDIAALSSDLDLAARATLGVIGIAKKDPILRERLNAALERVPAGAPRAAQNRALFETAAAYAGDLKRTVDEALRKQGAYVQLGAWIVQDGQDRPLHLNGFDEYPEGDFFVVDRWTLLPLNDQQRRQLKDLEATAKTLNEDGIKGLLKVKNVTTGAVSDFVDRVQRCADRIEGVLTSLQGSVKEEAASVRAPLEEARRDQQEYIVYVRSLKNKYAGESAKPFSSGAALLESTHGDLIELRQRTEIFVSGQTEHLAEIRSAIKTAASNVETALKQAEQVLQECKKEMRDTVASLTGQLSDLIETLRLSQEIDTAVLEFGEEVLKHTLDKVPENTVVNLKRAGSRKAGDAVVLKLAAGSAQRQRQVLEERRLDLHRVLPHIEMAIGIIFADPLGSTQVDNRFQFAPSYSILLKGFGDRGVTYNRLLTPGLGINMSALDFNKDDTPELGVAVVGSLFRDYFQVGYGYNINQDVDYWFFGLRLPLGTFTLPRPENTPQP